MSIPVSYNFRNIVARRATSLFTISGIALTVAVVLGIMGLVSGLRHSFTTTGRNDQLLVTRKSSTSELISSLSRRDFQIVKGIPGIAHDEGGGVLASHEMVTVITLEGAAEDRSMNVNLRGLASVGIAMRGMRITEGRMFNPGGREVVVGSAIARRYPGARVGSEMQFGRGRWRVVGIADGGATAYSSEVFADLNLASADYGRTEVLSSALIRVEPGAVARVQAALIDDRRLNVDAKPETSYYAEQTSAALPIQFMGVVVAVIMAAGSVLSAMNTMFAAVAKRSREIGTLRILGFSRVQILLSFLVESLVLSAAGGLLGILLVLPMRNWTTSIGSLKTFAEMSFQFRLSPDLMAAGFIFALTIGAIGGLLPASSAARKEILDALRS